VFWATSACAAQLSLIDRRDYRVHKRWQIGGEPHGIAVSSDGVVYVGLAATQSVAAIDPETGEVLLEAILDSPEIASTKELVTLRIDAAGEKLIVANGSDESVTILSLPDLAVLREITLEGDMILDAQPDPLGRYLFLLGSRAVHVFDHAGNREIRTISEVSPMAIAISSDGRLLAVAGSEDFPSGRATMVSLWDTESLREVAREPLQTDAEIVSLLFGAENRSLVYFAADQLGERPMDAKKPAAMVATEGGEMRMTFSFGDIVSSELICLPGSAGPQIAAMGPSDDIIFFAEKRCGVEGTFTASARRVTTASVYGVQAWALEYHVPTNRIYATDPAGYLTVYRVPKIDRRR